MPVQQGLCEWYAPASLWTSERTKRRKRARQICGSCPLLQECRAWALRELVIARGDRTVVGGMLDYEILNERHRLGIPNPLAPRMDIKQPKLLPVTSSAEKEATLQRAKVVRSHTLGRHEGRYFEHCPRCER